MNKIKELCLAHGIEQKQLAISIGVSQPTVSDWFNQKKNPRGERLDKLSEYLGVTKAEILGYTATSSTPVSQESHLPYRFKEARLQSGKTLAETATHLSLSNAAYAGIENGDHPPDAQTLVRIADFFSVSTDYLLGRTSVPSMYVNEPLKLNDSTVELLSTKEPLSPELREQAQTAILDAVSQNAFAALLNSADLKQLVRDIASEVFQEQYPDASN